MDIKISNDWHIYKGSYKNVTFNIHKTKNFMNEHRDGWTFYLLIEPNKLGRDSNLTPKDIFGKKFEKKYYDSKLSTLDWHGGMTFYECQEIYGRRVVKVGCDYMHIWDEDRDYNLDDVLLDVRHCINGFKDRCPNYGEKESLDKSEE